MASNIHSGHGSAAPLLGFYTTLAEGQLGGRPAGQQASRLAGQQARQPAGRPAMLAEGRTGRWPAPAWHFQTFSLSNWLKLFTESFARAYSNRKDKTVACRNRHSVLALADKPPWFDGAVGGFMSQVQEENRKMMHESSGRAALL